MLIEAVLIWIPTLLSVLLSFTMWNGLSLSNIHANGVQNYRYVVKDYPPFWPAIQHNVLWLLFLSMVATPLGLLLAVLLDRKIRGSRIYQTVFFIPVMMSLALVGIIWQLMYSRDLGFINNLLGTAGNLERDRLARQPEHQHLVRAGCRRLEARRLHHDPVPGRLKGVDPSLKEAAAIDGANGRQTFFRVVFPAMRPINIVVVVITIIEALRAFDIVYVINRGTNGLELISALVVQNLVGEGQVIGVGSALAVILLVVALIPIVSYLARTFGKENR